MMNVAPELRDLIARVGPTALRPQLITTSGHGISIASLPGPAQSMEEGHNLAGSHFQGAFGRMTFSTMVPLSTKPSNASANPRH